MNFVSTVLLTRHLKKIISTFNILDYRKDDDYSTNSIKLWYFVCIICSYCVLTLTTAKTMTTTQRVLNCGILFTLSAAIVF